MNMLGAYPFLSIVIPTYNRADFLDYSFEVHIPMAQKHSIQIFVFDNASTDNTKEVVDKWKKLYPHIVYSCNEKNIGPDANFELALQHPNTDYVWLLGDTYRIPEGGIEYVLNIAQSMESYDAIVLNLAEFIASDAIGTKDYTDQNALLFDLGALMTCLSCLVYSKKLINNANFSRYLDSYFIQTGIIFESIASRPFTIHWAQSVSILGLQHPTLKKNSWHNAPNVLEIACMRWSNFVFSLPVSYGLDAKLKCLKDINGPSILFKTKSLFMFRAYNILNFKSYRRFSRFFPLTAHNPNSVVFAISTMPRFFAKSIIIAGILLLKKNKLYRIKKIIRNET